MSEGKHHAIHFIHAPPGRVRPTAGACWHSECLRVSFQHAPFPAVNLVFAVFFFFLGGFHPGSLPFPPLSAEKLSLCGVVLVGFGVLFFRYVFWACFFTIFDAFLINFWNDFYMFFAYLFEQCFCLLFPWMFFECMHTFKTRDL